MHNMLLCIDVSYSVTTVGLGIIIIQYNYYYYYIICHGCFLMFRTGNETV